MLRVPDVFGGPDNFWKDFLTSLALYIIIDAFWVGLLGRAMYHKAVLKIQKKPLHVRLYSGMMLYPLLALAQSLYVLPAAREKDSWQEAAKGGFMIALIVYGSIEAINHALFRQWSVRLSLIDLAEGIIMSVLVAITTFKFHRKVAAESATGQLHGYR